MSDLDALSARTADVTHASQLKPIVGALIGLVADLNRRLEAVEADPQGLVVRPRKATPKKAAG